MQVELFAQKILTEGGEADMSADLAETISRALCKSKFGSGKNLAH